MAPVLRRLFTLLSALSLAVCLTGAVLWAVTWRGLEQSSSTGSFRRDGGFVVRTDKAARIEQGTSGDQAGTGQGP